MTLKKTDQLTIWPTEHTPEHLNDDNRFSGPLLKHFTTFVDLFIFLQRSTASTFLLSFLFFSRAFLFFYFDTYRMKHFLFKRIIFNKNVKFFQEKSILLTLGYIIWSNFGVDGGTRPSTTRLFTRFWKYLTSQSADRDCFGCELLRDWIWQRNSA